MEVTSTIAIPTEDGQHIQVTKDGRVVGYIRKYDGDKFWRVRDADDGHTGVKFRAKPHAIGYLLKSREAESNIRNAR